MKFGSVCSGIEAASVAFGPLGWKAAWLAEIEPFPSAVLANHYPGVANLGDMTQIASLIEAGKIEAPDMLCGGTPCQSFSVAGLRGSLGDARGNLSLEFIRIADAIDRVRRAAGRRPAYVLWENVPGVLSTKDNAFGAFLGGLCGGNSSLDAPADGWPSAGVVAGPSRVIAWRVLDAQFFGLAQRRKRVFVLALGGSGGWACADALLPVRHSLSGHPAPRREAGEGAARAVIKGAAIGRRPENGPQYGEILTDGTCYTLNCTEHHAVAHSLRGEGFDASEDGTGRGTPLIPVQPYTLAIRGRGDSSDLEYRQDGTANALLTPNGGRGGIGVGAVAFAHQAGGAQTTLGYDPETNTAPTLASHQTPAVHAGVAVRRLTPRECARLQGFPDDYLDIPYRGKPAADGNKYRALGNSMAVPVMRWIGERIQQVMECKR